MALQLTGERQVTKNIDEIAPDHRKRYEFAADIIEQYMVDNCHAKVSIMDAACGNGYGSFILASKLGMDVDGFDINTDAIDCANEAYSVEPYTHFGIMDLAVEPIEQDYDVVVSFETIEHMNDPSDMLKQFSEHARLLICSVPNESFLPYDRNKFPFHFRHYTCEEIEEILEENGWTPVDWYTQYSKQQGEIFEADDGRTLIVIAEAQNEDQPESN